MDRNSYYQDKFSIPSDVALRKESVDRNNNLPIKYVKYLVALRKESVDRNDRWLAGLKGTLKSLSARRAWIEISPAGCWRDARRVALRKESVDRNKAQVCNLLNQGVALRKESVDRNLPSMHCSLMTAPVALRKESVDRNKPPIQTHRQKRSRSPQGERG